jgi:hypothetical protein
VSTCQFADGALNGTTLVHSFFEPLSLLITPSLLQKLVILTNHDGAMRLSGGHTGGAQWTAATMVAPFKAKGDLLSLSLR